MGVIIGMDPHKGSATIEVIDERGQVVSRGRFGTDRQGYAAMLAEGRRHGERTWAVEGCCGIGQHIAHRLVHDGETVPVRLGPLGLIIGDTPTPRAPKEAPPAGAKLH